MPAKSFWGIDPDAHAFERFIRRFLTKYDRWNSPKYLFGESYGTPRSAVLSAALQNVDLNGIVLLSAILSFDNSIDGPKWNPGVDQAYALGLPTYAATAYYHHKLPTQPAALEPFLAEVEQFALGEYMSALLQGSQLPDAQRNAIAEKLHNYTGLPVAYLLKSNLRVEGGAFTKTLLGPDDYTTGRLDTRYKGRTSTRCRRRRSTIRSRTPSRPPTPPPSTSTCARSCTTAATRPTSPAPTPTRTSPGTCATSHRAGRRSARAKARPTSWATWPRTMIADPKMKVMLAGGYYDLATPYFEGKYEMHHLPMPNKLQANISYHYYESGHMVYVNEQVLAKFHDDVAAFIRDTESGK